MTTPHPSYTAMEAAWDPARREQARPAPTTPAPRVGRGTDTSPRTRSTK